MADLFVSYCSADRDRVGALAQALGKEGISVWWDRALIAGANYEAEIDTALQHAKAVIVAWTPASASSEWVRSEADGARAEGKLVPVMLETTRVPRPFDRLHTIDMTKWRGDRGNQGFPETAEAVKALIEGRAAKPIPWRRRLTFAAAGSGLVAAIVFIAALVQLGVAARIIDPGAFAAERTRALDAERSSPDSQEGFQEALKALATSFDLRTQAALSALNRSNSDRGQELAALQALASDQSQAIETQMRNAGSLWRQLGLLQFRDDPVAARAALERADHYLPDDPTTLTALAALYQREGRMAEAEAASRRALGVGGLSARDESGARQVIGEAKLNQGDIGGALEQFHTAIALADSVSDDRLSADLGIDLGNASFAAGDASGALQQFADAETFATSIPYPAAIAYARYNAALVLTSVGRLDEADAKLRSIDSGPDVYLKLYLDLAAADLAARRGDAQRALDIVNAVNARAQTLQVAPAANYALMRQGQYLAMMGQGAAGARAAHAAAARYKAAEDDSSVALASAIEAFALSRQPDGQRGCAMLHDIVAPRGYAANEVAYVRSLARCP